jgi:3'-phosphoadenosine 5'-phosphosulfate sulfotransferase (PAPS reductase)/FAD synthetase
MNKQSRTFDLYNYNIYIVAFSGGKDSVACVLHLLDRGISRDRIELWHHDIDGREGSTLMDWSCTRDYCRKFADAMGIKIYFSWKVGGFEGEMNRENSLTAPVKFECPDGTVQQAGGIRGKLSTRKIFPQTSASLSVRWCSAYLKIDVGRIAINNQKRFLSNRTLFISGERAEESSARAKYETFEPHACNREGGNLNRVVHQWRPVHKWTESRIWGIMKSWKINPHPAYRLGWGRLSCMTCIFGNANQWASTFKISPDKVTKIANYESAFGKTIHRTKAVMEQIANGTAYESMTDENIIAATSLEYTQPIIVEGDWAQPVGAFGDCTGPS